MSVSKEHSHDKPERVKWPHIEAHWQPQHFETPHRTVKKADNLRSHSWWWDSHISPKSSKWLQENLAEMDSKVNAMLKIIEEDADSFAKRAEMYYKRRPELLSLVEEFYRTYRALVERHTFLTRELRQNIAPALQAQLGASYESPLIPPSDLLKHGSDGFDLASLSSYSFPGALEFDDDSQSEFSAKSSKGHMDDVDASPPDSRVSFETRAFEFKPWKSSSEEENLPPHHQNKESHGSVNASSLDELRKALGLLEDENKALTVKSGEDDVKFKDLQSEVSSLLSKTKALETEDRLAKDGLNSLLQLKQELEAENLKLSHALISSKEEKTQLIEVRDRGVQEMLASSKRIHQLEEEVALLEQKAAAAHAGMLEGQEQAKRFEGECEKLHHTLAAVQEGNQREVTILNETFEKQLEGLQKRILDLERENEASEEQSAAQTVKLQKERDGFLAESQHCELQRKALEASEAQLKEQLASSLNKNNCLQEEKATLEGILDKSHLEVKELHCNLSALSSEKSLLLQKASGKANARQIGKDELSQESALLQTTHFRDLEVALCRLLEEKDMLEKREAKALHSFTNLEKTSRAESAKSKQLVDEHLARIAELEISLATLIEGRDLLEKQGREALQSSSKLREEIGLLETERVEGSKLVESLRAEVEELKKTRDHSSAKCQQFEAECKALKAAEEVLRAQFAAKMAEGVSLQNDKSALEAELAKVRLESESQLTRGAELEGVVSSLLHEKKVLESKDVEAQKALLLLEREKSQLTEEVKLKLALANNLNEGMSNLERERKRLSFDLEQAGKQVVELQEGIASLSNKYTKSQADCQVAEEGARTAQADIERHFSEIQILRHEINAKVDLISKLENKVTSQSLGLTKLEEKIVLLGNEKEKDIKTMAECEGRIHDLEKRVAESLAAQTALGGEVAQKSEDVRCLETELIDVRKEKETLQIEFSVTSAHAMLLQKQLDKCKELEDAQLVDLQRSADRIQSMEREAESMQLSVSEAVERNNALICEQQKSLHEITCMQRRIQDLEEQVRHVTEDKALLVKDNEEQNGKLQVQLQSSNDMNRSLEEELLKLHKAVSTFGDDNSIPVCEQSRSLDASFDMPDRIKHIHHKVGGLIEERAFLVSEAGSHKQHRIEMELRLQSLEREKDAVHKELLQALALGQQLRGDIQNLHGEKEQLAAMLGAEVMKGENQEKELKRLQEALSSSLEAKVAVIGQLKSSAEEGEGLRNELRALQEELKRGQQIVSEAKRNTEKLEGDLSLLIQAKEGVEGELSTKIIELSSAQEDAAEEIRKQIAHSNSLKQEIAVLFTNISKLEQDLVSVQAEKKIMLCDMEALHLEMKGVKGERESLVLDMKSRASQLEEKELEIKNLQEQLKAAESGRTSLAETLSEAKNQWDAEREKLEEELTQLKVAGLVGQKDLAVQLDSVSKLKDGLAGLQDERRTLFGSLEAMQVQMTGVRGENESLMSQVKAGILQLEEKECEIRNLQEQLKARESRNSSLAEALLTMKNSWSAEQERLQGELKAANTEGQNGLAVQLACVRKLEDELSGLHGERSLLQEDRELGAKKLAEAQREAAEQLNQIEDARIRELEKNAELMELSALAETLKQSLSLRDMETSSLAEDLKKSADCQSAAEKRFLDEISYLQSEEMKWRNEVTTNSALTAEKVASLRMEIAALHEELSLKIELGLKLQKDVESLTDECRSLSQALQDMAAEMQDLRDEHYIAKDVVIPSLEERVVELQDETTHLTISNERHVAEILSLRKQLEDATGEVLCLHDENAILKIELMLNVEMLKHVDGVFTAAKAQILELFDKLGLQEKHSQRMVTKATDENADLSRRLLSVTEERNGLKAEVQCLLAILVEVEHLQRELAVAREENCSVRGTESEGAGSLLIFEGTPLNSVGDADGSINVQMDDVQPIQSIRGGPEHAQGSVYAHMHQTKPHVAHMCQTKPHSLDLEHEKQQMEGSPLTVSGRQDVFKSDGSDFRTSEEGSDGKVEASVSSHACLIGQLKDEIYFLQEKIQRLELATPTQGSRFASNEVGARDIGSAAHEGLPSPREDSTAFSLSTLTVEEAVPGRLDDVLRLKEKNWNLVEENDSLKNQSLAAWTENNLLENSVKDLQGKLALLQEKNGPLSSEVSTCKADIDRLEGECRFLQEQNTTLQQDVKASIQDKRKSKETVCMLEDVITSLERNNRGLQAENEFVSRQVKELHDALSRLHDDGTQLIALLKMKMVTTLEEVKSMIDECTKGIGDEGIMQLRMNIEHVCSLPHVVNVDEDKQGVAFESTNERRVQETIREPAARSMLILTELQARADEANMMLEVVVFIRKLLFRVLCGEHTCGRETPLGTTDEALKREEACEVAERVAPLVHDEDLDLVGSAQHRSKLAECLHQAFVDERLEQDLLDLKCGRKQLKEELKVQLDEAQRMESELEKLQVLLEEEGERVERKDEKKKKNNEKANESMRELHEMLAQRRWQIDRIREEVMFGEEQQEAAAENQVTVLVSMESAPSMEGWDDEQVNLLSRELESLRTLNRRHSAELQTISQDLQSMGSIIKAAQDQLLLGSPQDGEDEIVSISELRTQKSNIVDLRTQTSRASVDSIQHLLSPSPHIVAEGDSVAARRSSSDGQQFYLKPRNFGFTWFLLLFSPDRKAAGLARSKSNKRWAALRPMGRSGKGSGSTALVAERSRRKAAGCWACMSNTSRLDSFDQR